MIGRNNSMDAEEKEAYRRLNASWKISSLMIEERVKWEERLASRVTGGWKDSETSRFTARIK